MTTGWVLLSDSSRRGNRTRHSGAPSATANPWRKPIPCGEQALARNPANSGLVVRSRKSSSGNLRMSANGSKEDIARPARNFSPVLLRFDSLSNSF